MFGSEPQDRGAFLAMLRSATGVALKIRRSKACFCATFDPSLRKRFLSGYRAVRAGNCS